MAWISLWALVLRAFGIPALTRSPEGRVARKERIIAMGKLRYVLIFGVLGNGLGLGLGNVVADTTGRHHFSAGRAATQLVISMVVFGLWHGVATWNNHFEAKFLFRRTTPRKRDTSGRIAGVISPSHAKLLSGNLSASP